MPVTELLSDGSVPLGGNWNFRNYKLLQAGACEFGSGTTVGTLTLADGSITDSGGSISFGNENLVTTGTLGAGVATLATGSTIGTLTLADGNITDSGGTISFGNENLTTTGVITGNSFITASDIGISGDTDLMQLTANTLTLNGDLITTSNVLRTEYGSNRVGIGGIPVNVGLDIFYSTFMRAPLDILNTATQLQINYDGSNNATFNVGSSGDLTIYASGGDISFGNENFSTTGTINDMILSVQNTRTFIIGDVNTGADIQAGANQNIFIGSAAGKGITTGDDNIVIGDNAGYKISSGLRNVIIGRQTGYDFNGNSDNICLGYRACFDATTNGNIAIGNSTLYTVQGGSGYNIAIGYRAGYGNGASTNDHAYNIIIGYDTGYSIDSGDYNIIMGYQAGYDLTNGEHNVLLGYRAGYNLTTGENNIILGGQAGNDLGAKYYNIILGYQACYDATTNGNVAIGHRTLYTSQGGSGYNIAIGYRAGYGSGASAKDHAYNAFIGFEAGFSIDSGDYNVLMGHQTGYLLTNGGNNIFLGANAGYRQTTLSNLLIVDNQQRANAATEITNSIMYGVMAATPASQTIRINAASFGLNIAPQAQQAHIVDADGTLADITTKFNTLLADLEGYGLLLTV